MGRRTKDAVEVDALISEYLSLAGKESVPLRKFISDRVKDLRDRANLYQRVYLKLRKEHGYKRPDVSGAYTSFSVNKDTHSKITVLKQLTGKSITDIVQQLVDDAFRDFAHKEKDSMYASLGGPGTLSRQDVKRLGDAFIAQKKVSSISEFLISKRYNGYGTNLKRVLNYVAKQKGVNA